MDKVINILMKRDGLTREEAVELIEETQDEMLACEDSSEAFDVFQDMLGLEPDYIMDIF